MAFDLTPINVKDATGNSKPMIVFNDGTNNAFANAVLDSTGAVINPATSGLQTTANSTLSTIASQTNGVSTAARQDTGNASLATIATNTGNADTNLGARADTAASSDTGTFSLIALFKRLLTRTPALGIAVSASSTPVVIASDQAAVAVSAASLPLPTGAATAANQSTTNTALGAPADAAVTNPASSSSVIAALKGILTGVNAATPSGTNIIGRVGFDQTTPGTTNGVVINATPPVIYTGGTVTRPADTTAYAAGDLVANSTTAGSVTYPTIQVSRAADQPTTILRMRLRKTGTATLNGSFRIHLYRTQPAVVNGDNGVWSTDNAANYVGSFDVTITQSFTDGAVGIGGPSSGNVLATLPASGATTLFYLIEARAAYTPASAEVFTPIAEVQ